MSRRNGNAKKRKAENGAEWPRKVVAKMPNRRRGDKKRGQHPVGLLKILMLPHLHA